jgi:hypothetical protein
MIALLDDPKFDALVEKLASLEPCPMPASLPPIRSRSSCVSMTFCRHVSQAWRSIEAMADTSGLNQTNCPCKSVGSAQRCHTGTPRAKGIDPSDPLQGADEGINVVRDLD